jgi:hypothetical protein
VFCWVCGVFDALFTGFLGWKLPKLGRSYVRVEKRLLCSGLASCEGAAAEAKLSRVCFFDDLRGGIAGGWKQQVWLDSEVDWSIHICHRRFKESIVFKEEQARNCGVCCRGCREIAKARDQYTYTWVAQLGGSNSKEVVSG